MQNLSYALVGFLLVSTALSLFRVVEIKRLETIGSDHFPLYIELALAGAEPMQQNHIDLKKAD